MIRLRIKRRPRGNDGANKGSTDPEAEADRRFRVLQIKRQSMTNLACELGVTIFIAYIVISLNGIDQVCDNKVHRECLDFYLLNGGEGTNEFVQTSCRVLRKSCRHSGLFNNAASNLELAIKEDPTNATLAGIDPETYSFYYHEILFCYCLLNDITFNDTTGALLTVSESSHGQNDCDFTVTRAIFFIVGVIIVALMEGSTMSQEKSNHSWENWMEVFGRLLALILSLGYFFGVVFYFQPNTNPNLKCEAPEFFEIADICTVMGIISLVAVCVFVFTFEISVLTDSIKHVWQQGKSSRHGSTNSIQPHPDKDEVQPFNSNEVAETALRELGTSE